MALCTAAVAEPEEIEVVASPQDGDALEHTYHSTTVFKLQDYYGLGQSLDSVVAKAPGVYIRRSGGFGSQTLLSVRGLSGSNVGIVLDDLPLSSVGFSASDLSLFPLELLESVEVYRGDGPIRFQAPLGGLIHLRTRKPQDSFELHSHAGMGSYYNRSAHSAFLAKQGAWNYVAAIAYRGSQGNFSYYNDKETLYTESDDSEDLRQNNASDTAALHFSMEHEHGNGSSQMVRGQTTYRVRGVPGSGVQPTEKTQARDWEASLRLSSKDHHFLDHALALDVAVDLLTSKRSFDDPGVAPNYLPELSMRAENDASLWQVGVDSKVVWFVPNHQTELSPRVAVTYFVQSGGEDQLLAAASEISRLSLDVGIGVEHLWTLFDGFTFGPGVRMDAWLPQSSDSFLTQANQPEVSPRLIVHWDLESWRIYANAGRRHRFPTLLELYGDNIGIGPSPGLESESGLFGDIGLGCELDVGHELEVDLAFTTFVSLPRNLIVFMQNSQNSVKALNVAQSTLAGIETSLNAGWAWLDLNAHYSFIHARDTGDVTGLEGNTPPGIAQHQLDLGLRVGPDWLRLGWDLNFRSQRFLDQANLRPLPGSALQALSLQLYFEALKLGLKARIDNLSNVRKHSVEIPGRDGKAVIQASDLIGYPLTGRTIFLGVTWDL
jgi:vitamin B12 transporter